MSCDRAWAYRYIAKLREPEVAWNDAKAPPRLRSKALGTAVHAVGEAWQTPGARSPDWRSLPGQIFLSGAHYIPHPERVHEARVEAQLGAVPLPLSKHADGPTVAYELHGVLWAGKRDLLVSAPGEFIRLKIAAPDGWALYDYKSSASIERYALTPVELERDPQANLYTHATCTELGLDEIPARWVYFETKKVRRAMPVDATVQRSNAYEIMGPLAEKAKRLDLIASVEDAEMNTGACGEYGGCYYHVSQGGPCNARRSLGGLIQARVRKKETDMPLSAAAQAQFDKLRNGTPAAKGAPPPPPPADEAPEAEAAASETAPALPKTTAPAPGPVGGKARGRKPNSAALTGPTGAVVALAAMLAAAQEVADSANADVADLLAKIKEACGA
jgi:hypothetical protein